jgi:hypothetical protein
MQLSIIAIPPTDPATRVTELGRAARDARLAYDRELVRAFGAKTAPAFASHGDTNRHPHRPGLCQLRDEYRAASAAYQSAYRFFHLPRGEG